jgi:uncharacterized protein
METEIWQVLWSAIALIFVIEGIMPFLSPQTWRSWLLSVISMSDNQLRWIGLSSMLFGVILLYLR